MNALLFLIVGFSVVGGCVWSRRDLFHPSIVYAVVYTVLLSVSSLGLSRYNSHWSITSFLLFSVATAIFLGCGILVAIYSATKEDSRSRFLHIQNAITSDAESINPSWFLAVMLIMLAWFLVSYVFSAVYYGTIPILSKDADKLRYGFLAGNMFTSFGGACGPIAMMLAAEMLCMREVGRNYKIAAVCCLVTSLVLYLTLVTRMPLVKFLVFAFVMVHYLHKAITAKLVMVGAAFVIVLFLLGIFVRLGASDLRDVETASSLRIAPRFALFANPYAYAANNFWNYDAAVRKFIDGHQGYNTSMGFEFFRGALFFLRAEGPIAKAYHFDSVYNESIQKVRGLNTVIYVWHFLKDFGPIGMMVLVLFLSLVIHRFYYSFLCAPSYFRCAIYGVVVGFIVFSFMIPLWSFWTSYFELLALTIAHSRVRIV